MRLTANPPTTKDKLTIEKYSHLLDTDSFRSEDSKDSCYDLNVKYPLQACDWMVWYPAGRVFSLNH